MLFNRVCVEAVDYELPPNVVTSAEIEEKLSSIYKRLRLPYGRLELMTGIKERRFWEPGTLPSQAAALAGKKAIEKSAIQPGEIDCLVHAAVCRDFMEPATASVIHNSLGLSNNASIFDVSNACLGVLSAMVIVAAMIECGQIKTGLVVCGETAEKLHDATIQRIISDTELTRSSFKKHFASLTIGSGAAAIMLTDSKISKSGHRLLGGALRTDTSANTLCREDIANPSSETGPLMITDSEALLKAGCALAGSTWDAARKELGWSNKTPDAVFTHQVGIAHKKILFETLELDPEKDFPTVQFLGNTGSAALPMTFAMGIEQGAIQKGENAALLGIGSGLSTLILGVEW